MKKRFAPLLILILAVLLIVCGKKIAERFYLKNHLSGESIIKISLPETAPSEAVFADGFGGFLRLSDFYLSAQ